MNPADYTITSVELKPLLGKVTLVDVREPEEFEESRIEGCVLIPLGEIQVRAERELTDKNADIVLYCAHGVRSMYALRALQMLGYTRLRSLDGGICAWEESR